MHEKITYKYIVSFSKMSRFLIWNPSRLTAFFQNLKVIAHKLCQRFYQALYQSIYSYTSIYLSIYIPISAINLCISALPTYKRYIFVIHISCIYLYVYIYFPLFFTPTQGLLPGVWHLCIWGNGLYQRQLRHRRYNWHLSTWTGQVRFSDIDVTLMFPR